MYNTRFHNDIFLTQDVWVQSLEPVLGGGEVGISKHHT